MASKTDSQGPPIECKNLWKIYGPRDKEALAAIQAEGLDKDEVRDRLGCAVGVVNATFNVNPGEIFCVMGLSGSGKSTLVRHVNRLIEPTAGQVLINGEDIGQVSKEELRQLRSEKIGMVFQHMALLPHRNVRENAAFALELREVERKERLEKAEKALKMVGLDGWETYYPDELSGGMQQRVGLARAIAADPDILLMDEPFSALDPLIRRQLQDQFIELSQMMQKTTIFITHDLDEAIRLGNRIAIMNNGELVQIGTPEDIVTQPADDYVTDFVAGISRLHLVFAPTIMHPIVVFRGKHPDAEVEDCPTASPDADLNHLIDIMVETEERFIRIIEENKCVGVVTRGSLLRAIQGKETS